MFMMNCSEGIYNGFMEGPRGGEPVFYQGPSGYL